MRIIIHGFDGIDSRIALIRFRLSLEREKEDQEGVLECLAKVIREFNRIGQVGVKYEEMKDGEELQLKEFKRGRERKD